MYYGILFECMGYFQIILIYFRLEHCTALNHRLEIAEVYFSLSFFGQGDLLSRLQIFINVREVFYLPNCSVCLWLEKFQAESSHFLQREPQHGAKWLMWLYL